MCQANIMGLPRMNCVLRMTKAELIEWLVEWQRQHGGFPEAGLDEETQRAWLDAKRYGTLLWMHAALVERHALAVSQPRFYQTD